MRSVYNMLGPKASGKAGSVAAMKLERSQGIAEPRRRQHEGCLAL